MWAEINILYWIRHRRTVTYIYFLSTSMDAWSSWVLVCRYCRSSADSLVLLLHPPMALDILMLALSQPEHSLGVGQQLRSYESVEPGAWWTMPLSANQRPLFWQVTNKSLSFCLSTNQKSAPCSVRCQCQCPGPYTTMWSVRGACPQSTHGEGRRPGQAPVCGEWSVVCAKWARSVKYACLHYHCDALLSRSKLICLSVDPSS